MRPIEIILNLFFIMSLCDQASRVLGRLELNRAGQVQCQKYGMIFVTIKLTEKGPELECK